MTLTLEQVQPLIYWMNERHAIYMRKAYLTEDPGGGMSSRMEAAWGVNPFSQHPEPGCWTLDHLTNDPILAKFRFCNVYRELDAVTVWIREHIREPYAGHDHLWFMLAIARHINWPATLQELIEGGFGIVSWPDKASFDPSQMTMILEGRQRRGDKVYTGAYMIRAEQHDHPWRHWPKVRYSAEIVLGKLWENRDRLQGIVDGGHLHQPTLQEVWQAFQDPYFTGWGPFMAQQVVADMRWTRYLRNAPDRDTWTHVGPGSARGLNRLHGRPVVQSLRPEQALEEFIELRELMSSPGVLAPWLDVPIMMDVSSCMCEWDKYERVRLGQGRPRALYVPGRGA